MATSRRSLVSLSAATLITAFGLTLCPAAAFAAPSAPASASDIQAQIVQKQHDLEAVAEQYNDAKIALDQQNDQLGQAKASLQAQQADLQQLVAAVGTVSASVYKGPQLSGLSTLMTSTSPREVLEKLDTIDMINDHNNGALTNLAAAEQKAAQTQAKAQAATDAAKATEADLASKKKQMESELPQLQSQLAALSPAAAAQVMDTAGGTAIAAVSAGTGGTATAQGAVSAALSRLGKPYVWAASGPNAFDCSGLTMWAYGQVGISLPHSSSAQGGSGPSVSLSALQPGDLVFMPGHVGMYIGNGQVVHAPTEGDVVKVVALSSMQWTSAARPAA
ncbi:MAG: NlpC/P60 family protein [Antricoccus sp.]